MKEEITTEAILAAQEWLDSIEVPDDICNIWELSREEIATLKEIAGK